MQDCVAVVIVAMLKHLLILVVLGRLGKPILDHHHTLLVVILVIGTAHGIVMRSVGAIVSLAHIHCRRVHIQNVHVPLHLLLFFHLLDFLELALLQVCIYPIDERGGVTIEFGQ